MKKNLLQLCYVFKHDELTHIIRIMRLSVFFVFVLFLQLHAVNMHSQEARITITRNNLSFGELITEIERQTDYLFLYGDKDINLSQPVQVNAKNKTVKEVLDNVLANKGLTYKVLDNYISIHSTKNKRSISYSEPPAGTPQVPVIKVTGTVVDQSKTPIIGANVLLKGSTSTGTVTDIDGHFSIEVPANAHLVFSYIGYQNKDIAVNNQKTLLISLLEDSKNLEEVVVTALGIKRSEKALGYAVQKVGGDKMTTVKSVDVGTALTGKIAGLNVQNSTEFNEAPSILLRGEEPLLVIDGVPYNNITLRDIASDDIESVDVLKGATASALYGSRGGSGAIMVTTKKGKEEGLNIDVNSSTMFEAGFLKLPKVQTSYSAGAYGKYNSNELLWGDKLDIGRTAEQYDPYTYEWREMPLVSKGKNNFKNFLEFSFVTNNNVSVTQKGKYGSFRTSLTHIYNKGQYPNTKLNKLTYTVGGDMKFKNLSVEGGLTYNKRFYPNDFGTGYGAGGYIYNLLVWNGSDLDIRDYKNYWIKDKENEQQNWPNTLWYDNPYFIANEIIHSSDYDIVNGYLSANYSIKPWLKVSLRSGLDMYSNREKWRNSIGAAGGWERKGYYAEKRSGGYSINNDFLITADHKFGNISLDGFVGGTIYFYQNDWLQNETQNGLTVPGYYSLYGSVDPVKMNSALEKKQVNSIYGKASAAWKSTFFLDITARNDWSSTLPSETRSYFYPSVSASVVLSEFIPMPSWIDFWKMRGSWTQTKKDLSIYDTNRAYTIKNNSWDGLNGATYPTKIRGVLINPSSTRSFEIGTALHFLKNRLNLDIAYYQKLFYNLTTDAQISDASGFQSTLINIDEEHTRKGVEISLNANIYKDKNWDWNAAVNWSLDRYYYSKIDPTYSTQKDWVKKGERWDWLDCYDWERDPDGNIIHENGYPIASQYTSKAGHTNPDWIFGFSNSLKYKNVTLSFTIDGRIGGMSHSVIDQALWMSGGHIGTDNQYRYEEVVNGNRTFIGEGVKVVSGSVDRDSNGNIIRDDRVFAPNDKVVSYESYMNLYSGTGNVWQARKQYLYEQTFIKLRELALTYNLPSDLCNKLKMKHASVSLIGNNLFIWTKDFKYSDPDKSKENLNSPSLRMIGCNLKVNF